MGPSGSGKSTLMNLIGCLDTPSQGEYWLNGHQVSKMTDNELARIRNREIGFVFQTFNLLPRATALHNVELPLVYAGVGSAERRKRAREALDRVQLGERMLHRRRTLRRPAPACGHRPRTGQPGRPSCWLMNPQETSTRVRPRRSCGSSASSPNRGQTVIMVTHEPDIAAHARRVIVLRDGLVASDDRYAAGDTSRRDGRGDPTPAAG